MKTKNLIAALLFAASSALAQVPSYVPTNGLVGWWPFNGNANDESGNGNNGSLLPGAAYTNNRFNQQNTSILMDGIDGGTANNMIVNKGVILPSTIASNSDFSISIWFQIIDPNKGVALSNPSVSYTAQTIFCGLPFGTIGASFNHPYAPNKIMSCLGDGANWVFCAPNNPLSWNFNDLTGWHNLLVVKSLGNISYIMDGNNVLSTSISYNFSSITSIQLGGIPVSSGEVFSGRIDDIAIWNRALTQQEITALYNAQTCNSSSNIITADGPTTFCAGNSVNLKSDVVGGTYQWKKNGVNVSSNGTSRTYKATATGSYTCVATCNGTALTSNAIQVTSKTNAAVTVTATGATSFCVGDSVTLNCTNLGSNYSVQWYRTNISMENATNYTQVVKQPGTYKVVSKNLTTGCSRISSSSVVVAVNCRLANPDEVAVDITESDFAARGVNDEPKGKIYIYPNPTSNNKFTVELMGLELNGDATLEVYNAMGQVLSSEIVNITNGALNRTIQIDEQSKGQLCLVRLIAGSEVYDSKVVIK